MYMKSNTGHPMSDDTQSLMDFSVFIILRYTFTKLHLEYNDWGAHSENNKTKD